MYLNCHSFHSLRYGTIPLQDLVQQAAACGVEAMALTDINTVTGTYEFIKACNQANIKPLIVVEFRSVNKLHFIGLAKNREGLAEMNRLVTKHNFEGTPFPAQAPGFNNGAVIYAMEDVPDHVKENEYIGIRPDQLTKLYNQDWKNRIEKMVILQPVTFRTKKEFNLHRVLRAIDRNIIGSKLSPQDHCRPSEIMIPIQQLAGKFADYPQIINNTETVINQCNFDFDF